MDGDKCIGATCSDRRELKPPLHVSLKRDAPFALCNTQRANEVSW